MNDNDDNDNDNDKPAVILIVGGTPDDWGLIPMFLDPHDPRPAREQFDAHYVGGWNPFKGFTFDRDELTLNYPGDPPYHAIGGILFREERILLFPSAWVLIAQPDETWEVARMD